jgi:hypothetical protein
VAIAWQDVVNLCGADLSAVPALSQTAILAAVDLQLDPLELGTRRDLAATFLAGHMGTLELRSALGPGGPLAGETVGPLDAKFQVPQPADPWYGTTNFGIEFLRICRQNPARFGFTV